MCGIAGVLYAERDRRPSLDLLKKMGDTLVHRGPDGDGYWAAAGIGFAHRRLAIIDVEHGAQPLANEDESVRVVFNGEIYNYRALRAALLARGHRFNTQSDTEVLVHLYEEHGDRLVEHLRGMFAFALWDARERRLLLARDRVGIKPLYVYQDDEKTIFGSEMKAILAHPGVARELDVEALDDYLAFGMISGPRSIFRHIRKLPPAHTMSVDAARAPVAKRYWSLSFDPERATTIPQWEEAIRTKLDETVRAHLVADVPVGAFLSGGIDSTLIVGSAAAAMPEPLNTFSIGFAEAAFNELPYARSAAVRFRTRHFEEIASANAISLIDRLTYFFDEPFADPSMIPTFLVSRLARTRVKVALSGDGGDEAFGGYRRYVNQRREDRVRRMLPASAAKAVGPLARRWPDAPFFANVALDPARAYVNATTTCRLPLRRQLLSSDVVRQLNGFVPGAPLVAASRRADPNDIVGHAIAVDIAVRVPDRYLVKVDRASMAESLEVRPPFLDHELLELAARIPSSLKVNGGRTKWILKRAGRAMLPPDIAARGKQGFDMPVGEWLRQPLRPLFEQRVLDPRSQIADLIDRRAVASAFAGHVAGRADNRYGLWALLVLASWAGHYR